jgi:hypothetical protein
MEPVYVQLPRNGLVTGARAAAKGEDAPAPYASITILGAGRVGPEPSWSFTLPAIAR